MKTIAAVAAILASLALDTRALCEDCGPRFAQLTAARVSAAPDHLVNIILSLGFKGHSIDLAAAEVQARRYRELYPRERTVIVSAGSANELRSRTSAILKPGESVHRLFVDSHGTHNELYYGVFDLVFLDEHQPYLQGPTEFANVLGSLKGRFASDATIVFEGCKVLPPEENEAAEISSGLMTAFGMKSGRVYANYTDGSNVQDDFIKPKFKDLHDWQSCAMVGVANVLYPITEAFSGIIDYGISNRGYLYTRIDDQTWCLDKSRLMKMRF